MRLIPQAVDTWIEFPHYPKDSYDSGHVIVQYTDASGRQRRRTGLTWSRGIVRDVIVRSYSDWFRDDPWTITLEPPSEIEQAFLGGGWRRRRFYLAAILRRR
jgi:hypothetical protein